MSDLLKVLFQSRTRIAVLRLLVHERLAASESELARRAGLSSRGVGIEVERLRGVGLARVEIHGASHLVRADSEHPAFAPLADLFAVDGDGPGSLADDDPLWESLAAYGAPLSRVSPVPHFSVEETISRALEASRTSGTALRVLPALIARSWRSVDWRALKEDCRRRGLKAELGLLVELTARAAGLESLAGEVQDLRDRRRSRPRYLPRPRNRYEKRIAEEYSLPIGRDWGILTSVTEDSVRDFLKRHGA